jgi:hypothetical protein
MASKVQDFGFGGKKRVSIQEPLFLYIEWGDMNPDNIEGIREIIEDIDLDLYPTDASKSITKNFPFLTFRQAESLFRELKENFDNFTFNGIALVSQVSSNNLLTGKVVFGDGPRISPFVLDEEYQNIPLALIYATRRDPRFSHYSFDDLTKYFCTMEPNLMDCYKRSLGLSISEMPIYPANNTIKGELDREGVIGVSGTEQSLTNHSHSTGSVKNYTDSGNSGLVSKIITYLCFVLSVLGIGFGIFNYNHTQKQEDKLAYLYKEQTSIKKVQDNEHSIDVISKYFVTHYFTGNKESILPYLSKGDAKFTQPTKAQVNSNILERISLREDGETYSVTYVVGVRAENGTLSSERISFDMKADDTAPFKWVVTSEPIREPFSSTVEKNN